jgi:hypothetical protein
MADWVFRRCVGGISGDFGVLPPFSPHKDVWDEVMKVTINDKETGILSLPFKINEHVNPKNFMKENPELFYPTHSSGTRLTIASCEY